MTPAAAGGADLGRASSGAKLLMVEDERNVAETLAERLRSAGFQVVRADSVASARRAIGEQEFKLALLDVGLPDGNGFELARLLRERSPATAIVFLTDKPVAIVGQSPSQRLVLEDFENPTGERRPRIRFREVGIHSMDEPGAGGNLPRRRRAGVNSQSERAGGMLLRKGL